MTDTEPAICLCHGLTDEDGTTCDRYLLCPPEDAPMLYLCDAHSPQYADLAHMDAPGECPTYGCGFKRYVETESGFFCLVCLTHHVRADVRPFEGPQMDSKPRTRGFTPTP